MVLLIGEHDPLHGLAHGRLQLQVRITLDPDNSTLLDAP